MTKFNVGDKVRMPGVPFIVEVLQLGPCRVSNCELGDEIFRFKDPVSGEDDWAHTSEFEKA